MENKVRNQLDIYISFRNKIKNSYIRAGNNNSNGYFLVKKTDILNWKKYSLYSLYKTCRSSQQNDYNNWKSEFQSKKEEEINFKILTEINDIKDKLKYGVALIHKEFLNSIGYNTKKRGSEITISKNKIILDFKDKQNNHYLICKIGKKESTKYIIYNCVKNYNSVIPKIIDSKNEEELLSNDITKAHKEVIKLDISIINKNKNEINKQMINSKIIKENNDIAKNYIKETKIKQNNIVNDNKNTLILETLILIYGFNKSIKVYKSKIEQKLFLINYDWIKILQEFYDYQKIIKEIQNKCQSFHSFSDYDNNLSSLIKNIKEVNVKSDIDIELLKKISTIPEMETFYESKKHYIKFVVVNDKINEKIKKIINNNIKQISFYFYCNNKIIYNDSNFIEIGYLDSENIFVSEYYLSINFKHINKELAEIKDILNSSNIIKYFKNRKVIINDKISQKLIISNESIGELIIIKNCISKTINKSINNIHIPKKNEVKENCIINNNTNKIEFNSNNYENEQEEQDEEGDEIIIRGIKDISFTPMIGLENIGQTCYMNASLQCFSNTDELINYFLNPNKKSFILNNSIAMADPSQPQLCIEFQNLIMNLWTGPAKSYYAPRNFKKTVGKIDSLFENFEANDAKDFVNFIIMRLHEELNFVDSSFCNKSNLSPPSFPINQYNCNQVLQSYLYDFQMNYNSIISTYFYGTTQGEFECQNCKNNLFLMGQNIPNIKYNYESYFFINFPLDEVRKFIMSNQMLYMKYMNYGMNPNKEVSLFDCFIYHQREECIFGYCDRCGNNNAQLISKTRLFTLPIYLIILLNRGKGIEFNIKINFPEYLDTNQLAMNPNGQYILYGVVKHFGDNSSSGHFASYCRSPIDNSWYFYNDAIVAPINETEKGTIQENGLTYILFYKKRGN